MMMIVMFMVMTVGTSGGKISGRPRPLPLVVVVADW